MAQYYFVQNYKFPSREGAIVIRFADGKLETVSGDFDPSDFGCSVDSLGGLHVSKGYKSLRIDVDEARNYLDAEPSVLLLNSIKGRIGGMARLPVQL